MNSDGNKQPYDIIVTKSFYVLYLINSSQESCELVRLFFYTHYIEEELWLREIKWINQYHLISLYWDFLKTNSPLLFTLLYAVCQCQMVGQYQTEV